MKSSRHQLPFLFDTTDKTTDDSINITHNISIKGNFSEGFYFYLNLSHHNPHKAEILGIALCRNKEQAYYVPINHSDGDNIKNALSILKNVFEDDSIIKISHDIKRQIIALMKIGISLNGFLKDIMIGSYLLDPNKSNHHQIETIALTYLNKSMSVNKDANSLYEHSQRSGDTVLLIKELEGIIFDKVEEEGLLSIYNEIEMPLIRILAKMEMIGILIDKNKLSDLSSEMTHLIDKIEETIYEIAGERFNINSPRQLASILFDKIKLKPLRKTKTGFSTDNDTLQQLSLNHQLPAEILNYRMLFKLKSTYIDALPPLANDKTGRINTTFHQATTATGRLSSSDPNLQNIPNRGEWGTRIRAAFVAPKGFKIVSSDYSQIELRLLAHLSGDERLTDAFNKDQDIHSATACYLFNVAEDKVLKEMRRIAKVVNFGILYGMSPFGLSEALKISTSEASEYINNYFKLYWGVKNYIDKAIKTVRDKGFAETIFGRKRLIPDINNPNAIARQQAERLAVNTPIQGSAADLIKIAMIKVDNVLTKEGFKTKMILQIHDELLFESPDNEVNNVIDLIRNEMQGVASLKIPLKVDIHYGNNWGEAH